MMGGGIIGIILAVNNYSFWSIVVQQLCTGLISLFLLFYIAKWLPILYFKLKSIYGMMRFGIFMFLSGLLEGVYSRIDIFLIAKVFSPATLGLYTRAQGLDLQIRSLSSSSLMTVLFPTFVKIKNDKVQLKKMFYQYFELISFLFCLLGGIFYLSASQLFLILFGNQWVVSAEYYKILVLAGFAYPLSNLSLSIIEARGNSKNFFKVEIIKKIIFLPVYFIAFVYGIKYFLFSVVFLSLIGTFLNVHFVKYELDISVFKTIKFLAKYLANAILIILAIEVIFKYFSFQENFVSMLYSICIFSSIYLVTNFLTKSKGVIYTLALLKK